MRADGVKLKNIDPIDKIAGYIMTKRYDTLNSCTIDIPLEPMDEYIRAKHRDGVDISHMALILSAYVRVLSEYPQLNRFFVNKRPYARTEVCVAMVVLKAGGDYGQETMSKMYFDRTNTVFDVNNIINGYVAENRNAPDNNKTEKLIKILLGVPGILNVGVGLFKWMDKHGLLPKSIIDASPFHNSLVVTNLASIRTNHIYHHLYDFGTSSIFLAMGIPHYISVKSGKEIVNIKTMPIGVVMDERIANGSYFARAFRRMQQLLKNPELLETPPEPEKILYDPAIPEKKLYKFK
ncbi:MAG: hypothetical protein IKF53_02080 [Clostridia bacterium]|nr:hypothetical protein [Clostridia bacterium]